MPLPPNLHFTDRLAEHSTGWYFLCQRRGHQKIAPRFDYKDDATDFRAAHDTAYHNTLFRHLGFEPAKNIALPELCHVWRRHVDQLEIDQLYDPQTTRHYYICCDRIERACRAANIRTVRDLTPEAISLIVRWFRKNTKSEGALTVKALAALKKMIRWKGLAADWQIPHTEIQAKRTEKRDLDSSIIQPLVAAMPAGSLEEAAAYLKARTGARDVEIYKAKKEEFDLDVPIEVDGETVRVGIFAPVLHNKSAARRGQAPRRHAYVITADAVEKVRPFVKAARMGGFVFVEETGRHVTRESMRPRIRAAAKRAGFVAIKRDSRPRAAGGVKRYTYEIGSIDSIAQIRSEVITIVDEETSTREAAAHIGHADQGATADRWYIKDRLTKRRIAEKYRPAAIIAKALPLCAGDRGV